MAGPFGVLCDRAREVGALVHLEFMPMLSITDLASAWTIVSGADRPNGGIMFDTWHFFHTGADFGLLEQVPGDRIFGVQFSDADPQPGADLGQDTFNRLLPGDGSLDLVRVLGVLDRIGGLHSVGPEVISPMTAAMAPAEAARVTRGTDRRFDSPGPGLGAGLRLSMVATSTGREGRLRGGRACGRSRPGSWCAAAGVSVDIFFSTVSRGSG